MEIFITSLQAPLCMIFADNLFKNKIAIVTGGGTGIGKSIASSLGKLGANLAIASRKQENVEAGAKEIRQTGAKCVPVQADLRNIDDVKKMVNAAVNEYGKIDFLVNNAGGQFLAPIEKISPNGFDAVVKTNLYSTFYCCKEAGEYMKKQNYGKIINIVTIYALKAGPGMAHSGAARSGVVNFTKSLALEWAKHNITVNAIAPGFVETGGFKDELLQKKDVLEHVKSTVPLKRFATAQEIADAALYLLSPSGDYITGHTLVIDGGALLGNWPDFASLI